jgi:uncharacterized protein YxeA
MHRAQSVSMKKISRPAFRFLSLLLAILMPLSSAPLALADQGTQAVPAPAARESQGGDLWIPWAQTGGKVGDDVAISNSEVLAPLYQTPDGMWFADIHFKDVDGSGFEGNAGGGYRHLFRDSGIPFILGVNGFYDRMGSDLGNDFNQGGVGVELLAVDFDVRANGYFPESKTYLLSQTYTDVAPFISGNTIGVTSNRNELREDALPGFDVEGGLRIPVFSAPHEIRVYGGYFYFDEDDAPTVDGPRFRAEWRIDGVFNIPGSRVTVEGSWQDDDVRGSEWFGGVAIRIPFDLGGRKYNQNLSPLEKRMLEPIIRDMNIVTAESTTIEQLSGPAINPFTGRPYSSIYFAEEGGTGPGIETDPDTLNDAITSAGVDGVVAALDTGGTINDGPALLANGMVLIGGGGMLPVRTLEGASGFLTIPGGGPATINDGGDVVTLADQNMVFDVTLTGGGDGINGSGVLSPWINNVTADNMGDDGIELDGLTGNLLIENSSFDNNGNDGINIDTVTGNVTILNTTADGNGNDGLVIGNVTGNVFVDPSSFSGNLASGGQDTGVYIYTIVGNVTLLDLTITGNTGTGLLIDDVTGNVLVQNSVISGNSNYGIEIYDVNGNTTLTGITANDNDQSNLYLDQNGFEGDVLIDPSSFNNSVNGYGLEIYNVFGNTTLIDVTADDNNQSNLYLDQNGYAGNLTIRSSGFNSSVNGNGLEIYNVFGNTTITNVTADDNNQTNLYIDQNGYAGNVLIDPSSFSRSVNGYGLEIYNVFGNTTLVDVTADDNNQTNLYFDQNGYEGDLTIRNSEFNRSVNGYGLEIYNVFGDTRITDVNANDNSQSNLYIDQNGYTGNVLIDPSSFSRSANNHGMQIYFVNGNISLIDVTADDNDQSNLVINQDGYQGDVTIRSSGFNRAVNSYGLEIYNVFGDTTITDVTANDNNQTNLYISQNGYAGNVLIDPSSFSRSVNDRGVDIQDVDGDVTLEDVTADDNNNRNINIENVSGNVLLDNVSGDGSSNARGVAVNDVTGDVTIQNSNFNGNQGTNINIGNSSGIGGSVIISNTTANDSQNFRGIDINDVTGDVTLQNVTADDNNGTNLEITNVGGSVLIDPSSFSGSANGRGVDIDNITGNVTLEDVTANDNDGHNIEITDLGGDVTVAGTTANNAGLRGLNIDSVGDVTIQGSRFDGNQFNNIDITDSANVVIENTDATNSQSGRGLDIVTAGDVTITDSAVNNNAFRGINIDSVNDILVADSSAIGNGSTDLTFSNCTSSTLDNVNFGSQSDSC